MYRVTATRRDDAHALLALVNLVDLSEPALTRALQPFRVRVRTLDALHLATIEFLRRQGETVELATYHNRLVAATEAIGIPIAPL